MLSYSPDDYNASGQLRLPLSFWAILLLQARTWILFIMAGASRQQGADLLELFYPDTHAFWLGLALGIPAAVGLLLTGYRRRLPRLWQAWRWILALTLLLTLGLSAQQSDEPMAIPVLALMLLDGVAVLMLLFNRRLRDCFNPQVNP